MGKEKTNEPRFDSNGARMVMRKRDYFADLGGQFSLGLMANLVGQLTYFYTDKVGAAVGGVGFALISSDVADKNLSAILEAWAPAEAGAKAIVDILYGVVSPSGKLPVSVAVNAGQIPIYYNHPWGSASHQGESIGFANYLETSHKPRYCFGYGLSYGEFVYSDMKISKPEVKPDELITVSCQVMNVSNADATEIVQCYISDRFASRTRPVKELVGFVRVLIPAGEQRAVTFFIEPSQTAFLDKDMRWKIEKGQFDVMLGKSSDEICFSKTVQVTEDAWIDGKRRAFYARTEVR